MYIKQIVFPAICCLPLLSGCSSYQSSNTAAWQIQPFSSIRNSTEKPEAYYQLGRYYQGQSRYEQAIQAYRKALAADNNFVEARNGLGVIYSIQGKYTEAIEVLKVAAQQSPKAAHIYNNLGYAYYLQGRNDEAITALREAANLDPHNQRALNNLAQAYARAGNQTGTAMASTQTARLPDIAVTHGYAIAGNITYRTEPATTAGGPDISVTAQQPQISPSPENLKIANRTIAAAVPQVASQIQAVQIAPNVYELREQHVMPVQQASTTLAGRLNRIELEIANGNGVTGMAKRVKQYLYGQGFVAERLTNQTPFKVQITQIQYRAGHQMEAQRLQSGLPRQASLIQSNSMHTNINVRLVLGKDIAENVAFFDGKQEKTRLALNTR
ncbi:MAG: tetratricopeptide repeat protein [Sulfuriferula sp.]|nr:tetratricopeptide repeat protein [Sulfuriferula sp.]